MQQHGTHGISLTFGARICARRSSCVSGFAASVRGAASAPTQPTWITSSRIAVIGSCLFAVTICRAYVMHVTVAKRPQKSRKLRSKNGCSLPPSYVRARALAPVCTGTPSQERARKVDHLPPMPKSFAWGQKTPQQDSDARKNPRSGVSDSEERFRRQGTFRSARSVSGGKGQASFRAARSISDAGDGGRERSIKWQHLLNRWTIRASI